MRAVLDTSVIVAAVRSRHGYSNRLLQMAHSRLFRMLATPALFLEYEDVLSRSEQRLAHGMDERELGRFLTGLAAIIEPVRVYYHWRPQLADADDEMVLESALNGAADAIATHNLRDFSSVTRRFGIRVMTPGELVKELLR